MGNWKMHKTRREAHNFIKDLNKILGSRETRVEVGICPPFTLLETTARLLEGTTLALGAQNMHWEKEGAFTGEVSPLMLKDLNCIYVIIGHSERRKIFKETDEMICKKIAAAFNYELKPILCVGETLEEREDGKTFLVLEEQLQKALWDLPEIKPLVLA
jgi:triosephosphate isomerase